MILNCNKNNKLYSHLDFERMYAENNDRQGNRDDFERDYGRIIHSSAFRRLQGKSQVFGPSEGDFHRTRLTHTLEVAQIARGIVIHLNNTSKDLKVSESQIDMSLIEAAALAHDLGHPPFGHQGERALHKGMQKIGKGFEGNAHTFRLLTRLERNNNGLNLTRATLLAICKYPIVFDKAINPSATTKKPPKSNIFPEDIESWKWLIQDFTYDEREYYTQIETKQDQHHKSINKSLECSIIELADDIAYATHDLQDVLKHNLLSLDLFKDTISQLENSNRYKNIINQIQNLKPSSVKYEYELKNIIANLISKLIQDISLDLIDDSFNPRLKFKAKIGDESKKIIKFINNLINDKVIQSQRLQTLEWRGGYIVEKLFETLMNEPKLLPNDKQKLIENNKEMQARIVCDYIAGMTDKYAENFYKRLFGTNGGRLFDL